MEVALLRVFFGDFTGQDLQMELGAIAKTFCGNIVSLLSYIHLDFPDFLG